jgi:hypothetical protein
VHCFPHIRRFKQEATAFRCACKSRAPYTRFDKTQRNDRTAVTSAAISRRTTFWSTIRDFVRWRTLLVELSLAIAVGIVSLALGMVALRITPALLSDRWTIGGADQVLHYMIFTSGTQVSPFAGNDRLGFPESQNLFFAPLFDPWSALFVQLAGALGAGGVLALNLYNVLGFVAVGITAYLFFRLLGTRRSVAAVFGALVSAAPFHFFQIMLGHPFIANYWAVPLIGVLSLMVAGGSTNPFEKWVRGSDNRAMRLSRRIVPIAILALLVGLTQSYYYVFGAIVVGGIWGLGMLRTVVVRRRLTGTLWPTITTAALFLVIGVQLALLANNWGERYQRYFAGRTAVDSELYGGKITSLLLPSPGSGFALLGKLAAKYQASSPLVPTSESPWTALIASLGMGLICLALFIRLLSRPRTLEEGSALARLVSGDTFGVLSAGFLWSLLFFVVGGLGTVFAFVVSPEIRAWSRLSVVVSLFAVAFLALLIDRLAVKRVALGITLSVVAVVGVVDQIPRMSSVIDLTPTDDSAIKQYVADAERALGRDCGVVELPLKGFPETGQIGNMGDYDEALPFINATSNSLRWSYGAVRGTKAGDFWSSATSPSSFAELVRESGACAVQVDTYAYASSSDWAGWVDAVADAEHPSISSPDSPSRYLLFEVRH